MGNGRLNTVLPGGLAAAGLAALVVWAGLDASELTEVERARHMGGPLDILAEALDPSAPGGGHMPLSYWMRWVSLGLFEGRMGWRLHAALAALVAVGITWWVAARRGPPVHALLAGGLIAIHPMMLFHAQDGTNAAMAMVGGALTLWGLVEIYEGVSRGSRVLAIGLVVGVLNDLWFLILACVALGTCAWVVRRSWDRDAALARIRDALVPVALVTGPSLGLFGWRSVHATRGEVHVPLEAWAGVLRAFPDAFLHGLSTGGDQARAGVSALVVVILGLLASLRGRRPVFQMAGTIVLASLVLACLAALLLGIPVGEGAFGPATFAAVLPAFVLAVVGGIQATRAWVGGVVLAGVAALSLLGVVRHHVQPGNTVSDSLAGLEERLGWQDLVVAPAWLLPQLRDLEVEGVELSQCLPADPVVGGDVIWFHVGAHLPEEPPICEDKWIGGRPAGLLGFRVFGVHGWVEGGVRGPGVPTQVHRVHYQRGTRDPEGMPVPVAITVEGADGMEEPGLVRISTYTGRSMLAVSRYDVAESIEVALGVNPEGWARVAVGSEGDAPDVAVDIPARPDAQEHRWILRLPPRLLEAWLPLPRIILLVVFAFSMLGLVVRKP